MQKLELLAPAKDYASAIAAVDHGADAIYIGGESFGARKAAGNSAEDIAKIVIYAHQFGVKVYATFNTVIFDNELNVARRAAQELVDAGVDALIIQDMAVTRMGLNVELHASTQMCNMTVEGVKFLEEVGFSRVVLERALSKDMIAEIAKSTNVEIEAFIHGAICVGHSGRCLMSRSMSSRSGNRGECSQPCRMTYDLCDIKGSKILSNKHLLSVKDLNLSARIGEMIDAGVGSFKIEGRLKDIGYTKNIVAHYRRILDAEISRRKGYTRSSCGVSKIEFEPNPVKSFTRGESEYLFDGESLNLASFETPKSMGEELGEVIETRRGEAFKIAINTKINKNLKTPNNPKTPNKSIISSGDGICFVSPEGLKGTNINRVEGEWIYPNRMDGILRGVRIFRNYDKSFADALATTRTKRKIAVKARLSVSNGCATLTYVDEEGFNATMTIVEEFAQTQNSTKMREVLHTQISKCGDTIFEVERANIEEGSEIYFIPSSRLASLRRDTLAELQRRRIESMPRGGRHFVENIEAHYPENEITAEGAVTNHMATQFYVDHGVNRVAPSWECAKDLAGALVMESSYCLRREIGECLKEGSKLRSDLFLHRGAERFRLEFDCLKCQMNIYKL
ncbi:MAG: U32 family peptidase [Rikenellaceae bacterium]